MNVTRKAKAVFIGFTFRVVGNGQRRAWLRFLLIGAPTARNVFANRSTEGAKCVRESKRRGAKCVRESKRRGAKCVRESKRRRGEMCSRIEAPRREMGCRIEAPKAG